MREFFDRGNALTDQPTPTRKMAPGLFAFGSIILPETGAALRRINKKAAAGRNTPVRRRRFQGLGRGVTRLQPRVLDRGPPSHSDREHGKTDLWHRRGHSGAVGRLP